VLFQGEHYPCEITAPHDGIAHANAVAELIWDGAYEVEASFANRKMRVGRTIGRTLYLVEPNEPDRKKDRCIGMVDTPGLAEIIAMRWNYVVENGYGETQ
jgi:hypothetical protein